VARLGEEEFAVVMPQTSLAGAGVFADRLRTRVTQELSATVSCSLAEAREVDDAKSLLARVDSALYSAKAAGGNRLFVHTGTLIREQHGAAAATATGTPSAGAGKRDKTPATQRQGNSHSADDVRDVAALRETDFIAASTSR
jgi:Diguanylate cyclase, GGDEF domain